MVDGRGSREKTPNQIFGRQESVLRSLAGISKFLKSGEEDRKLKKKHTMLFATQIFAVARWQPAGGGCWLVY